MKNLRKKAALSLCLIAALTAVSPAFSVYAEDEDIAAETEEIEALTDETAEDEDTVTVLDEVYESGDIKYKLDTEDKAWIIGCSSDAAEWTVPSEIDGYEVTSIDRGALVYLSAKKIVISGSVTFGLDENPFAPCLFVEEFEVAGDNTAYAAKDGVLYSKDMKKLICYPPAKKGSSFTVPEGTEEIGVAAFYENKLEEILLPSSIKTLNRHCFSFNTELKKIDLSHTQIDELPPMSFVSSSALSEVLLPDSLVNIEVGAFMECTSLLDITLPEKLDYIGQSAFMGAGLTKIVVPESVTYIGYNALGYKDEETSVTGFTVIGVPGTTAQKYCKDTDTEFDYANDFTFMSLADYESQLEFESLGSETSGDFMYIPDGDGVCITYCGSFDQKLEVPSEIDGKTVTSVYQRAFTNCTSTEIILPDTVVKIGENAFSEYLRNLTVPGNCTEIEGEEPFIRCMALESITVGEGNGNYSSENGVLYNKDKTLLITYPQSKSDTKFEIPGSVKEIAKSGCCYNTKLEEVVLTSVETIGDYAFEGCTSLKSAGLSKKLKTVGTNAFLGCKEMKSIRVYNKVESIAAYAFGYDYDDELAASVKENAEYFAENVGSVIMPYSLIEGFKMYVDKDSLAYQYATDCGIETVADTKSVGGANFEKGFLYAVLGGIGAVILAVIGVVTGKKISRNKKNKPAKKADTESK